MKKIFISLGPWCHTAGILQSTGLRSCSFPFDWCQSGSIQHKDILQLSPEAFYYRHIHSPAQFFDYYHLSEPDHNGHTLGRMDSIKPIYGYTFFYNPHRPPGLERDYFLRCLQRFHDICHDSSVKKIFLLADYIDKPGNEFLHDVEQIHEYVHSHISVHCQGEVSVVIYRTKVVHSCIVDFYVNKTSSNLYHVLELMPISIEDNALLDNSDILKCVQTRLRTQILNSLV
jgi:hypothetical protein